MCCPCPELGALTHTSSLPLSPLPFLLLPHPIPHRVAWAEATSAKMQSAPTFSQFKDDEQVWVLLDKLAEIAASTGGTVAQVALRWLLHKKSVCSVVIGPRTVAQLQDNLQALKISLSREQVAELDALSAKPVGYPHEMVNRINAARSRAAAADKY